MKGTTALRRRDRVWDRRWFVAVRHAPGRAVWSFSNAAERVRARAVLGFPLPPSRTDLVGYERLIAVFRTCNLQSIAGDVLEIGAFCGGGTYKLAKFFAIHGIPKSVIAVDCFDIGRDDTRTDSGIAMTELYGQVLKGRSQREVFDSVTAGLCNVRVIADDSRNLRFEPGSLCFAFIDGNHAADYVRSDFNLAWGALSVGGVVAFHDYGGDLPHVTDTVDKIIRSHQHDLEVFRVERKAWLIFLRRVSNQAGPA